MFLGEPGDIQTRNEMRGCSKAREQAKQGREIRTVHLFVQSLHLPLLLDELDFASISFPVFVISAINSHT